MTRELVFFPSWTAGRRGYAERIREVFRRHLSERGLRLTRQRERILDVLLAAEQHVTQQEVYQAVRSHGIGRVTVFRALKMLEECQLVERVTAARGVPKYEIKHERPHHDHLICVDCGTVQEIQWPEIERIQDRACRQRLFFPLWHRHEVFGRCQACQSRRRSS